ncbi:DUF4395 domain-containing protein [Bacillus sp. V3-13]|uniref:DUF4395 domain-containing protein n=1 Tax=Bacillus sp. V3-13 TaxID=2053728 RepID=UPI000C7928B9|nr:DUF4395 domain-containing protein [Bacillus sp. V3-13]PLR78437.1 DUF4395 domain-containing protein [Bacillus sp. V3-13]
MSQEVRTIPRPLVRLNQSVIAASVLLTWLTGQIWLLAIPLIAGLCGLLFGVNPIMKIGSTFLKKPYSQYIPEEYDQQQFNQIIAVICLTGALIGYAAGWNIIGHIFSAMVALASVVALLGFCIGCFIRYQWLQYRHRTAK